MSAGETITRTIMGNVPPWVQVAFYAGAAAACAVAAWGFYRRARQRRRGAPNPSPTKRRGFAAIWSIVTYLTFHRQLLRDRYAGVAHLLMFYGFFILFIGTCLVFLEYDTPLHFYYGRFYLIASLVIDLGGVAFLVGLAMFLARRARGESKRILRHWWVSAMAWLLLTIGVTGFLLEALRIAENLPGFERWSVVGYALALALRAIGLHGEAALSAHRAMWITHAVLCIAFFAVLPVGFFGHITYGAASWMTRTRRQRSHLRPLPPTVGDAPGAWASMLRHDLLQADACTTCGRCNDVCPAHAAGKPLRPREVVLGLRRAMDDDASPMSLIPDDVLWSCTTCGACNEACPVGIEVYDKIIDLRRGRVEQGEVPRAAEKLFESTAASFNPFEKPNEERTAWAAGLSVPVAAEGEKIELLYWIGCAGSFDPQGRGVSRAMVRILNHLGVNYRVLGKRERCTGDPARRMGEEGLFRQLARLNLDTLAGHGVTRVLTHCPHCFNTFRNEYPELNGQGAGGGQFEVEHHSQFLARMIREGRLKSPTIDGATVTFHDPCYLGRGNGETQAPRDVLLSLPQLQVVEMERHGRESFCCGAGGGSMWLDVPGQTRVENLRAREAADTGATVVATACPFCKGMLEAGNQSLNGSSMQVKDLAELIAYAHGL